MTKTATLNAGTGPPKGRRLRVEAAPGRNEGRVPDRGCACRIDGACWRYRSWPTCS